MRIICIGTDPAGLYLGVLLKRKRHAVRFIEHADAAVAGPPAALVCNPLRPRLALADPEVLALLNRELAQFDTVVVKTGREIRTQGLKFAATDVPALVEGLKRLARSLGCEFAPASGPPDPDAVADCDVLVLADGAASRTRDRCREFEATLSASKTKFIVWTLQRPCDALTYAFRSTSAGIFHACVLPRGRDAAGIIVEASADAISASGMEIARPDALLAFCRDLFPDELGQATPSLESGHWREFVTVQNRSWHAGARVLLGAAAYTAHFSVGLDLRSWLEDAECLSDCLSGGASLPDALSAYEATRRPKAESLQRAAGASLNWFENVRRHIDKAPAQFVFSLLTSSMRITYPRIAKAAPELVRQVDTLVAGAPRKSSGTPPPMLAPLRLRELELPNRIVVSPMCMYSALDGTVNDFHLVHLGSRAVGGAGLVLTEMTDVLPEGRISLHCAGMYAPEHVGAWQRVVQFVHAHSDSKIGIQLAHAGRKGSLTRSWEGHQPLGKAGWEIIAPSPVKFAPGRQVPREMTRADMDRVRDAFARAAVMADASGFDMIELHFAHGYLLSSFISPLSNRRTDAYGGSLENRMRFPLEVFAAVRAVWPSAKPISTRISASDWAAGGTTIEDAIEIARRLHRAGNDILAVSSGGVVSEQGRAAGRLYQAGFSDQIRNELNIPTMAVGGIVSHGDANTIVAAGRADLCALARGYLVDPYFVRHAAHAQGYALGWPSQYRRAREVRMRGA